MERLPERDKTMYARIRIYRMHDQDVYAMYMTLGKKPFRAAVIDALRIFLLGKPRITEAFQISPLPECFGGSRLSQINIPIEEEVYPEIARVFSSMNPKCTALFVKMVLRTVFMKEFLQFYATTEINPTLDVSSLISNAQSICKQMLDNPVTVSQEDIRVVQKPDKPSLQKKEATYQEPKKLNDTEKIEKNVENKTIETTKPKEKEEKPTDRPTDTSDDIPDGIAGLMGLIGGLTVE